MIQTTATTKSDYTKSVNIQKLLALKKKDLTN